MDKERLKVIIEALQYGPERLARDVKEVLAMIEHAEAAPLPPGIRRFQEGDWMGYAGAGKFPDGTKPLICDSCWVNIDDPEMPENEQGLQQVVLIYSDEFVLGISCEGTEYANEFGSYQEGLEVMALLARVTQKEFAPLLSFLKRTFRFSDR